MSVPLAFGQTDFEITEEYNPAYYQFLQQKLEAITSDGVFKEHDIISNEDGTYTMSTHSPYFETEQGEFVPYRVIETDDIVQIELDVGKLVFDKNTGAVSTFNNDGILIESDSYVVRQAQLNSDTWNELEVNNESVVTTVEDLDGVVTVSFIRENFEGIFKVEYIVNEIQMKTTAYFTNNFYEDSKFAFTQTLDLPDSIISINNTEEVEGEFNEDGTPVTSIVMEDIDLTNYVGQSFPREVLEQNMDLILQIKDMYYNSGIGFDNLWSVNIITPTKVSLDYANVEQTQTEIGQTVELDPTLSYTRNGSPWASIFGYTNNFTAISNADVTAFTIQLSNWAGSSNFQTCNGCNIKATFGNPAGNGNQANAGGAVTTCTDSVADSTYSSYKYYNSFDCSVSGGNHPHLEEAMAQGSIKARLEYTPQFATGSYYWDNSVTSVLGDWSWSITYTVPTAPSQITDLAVSQTVKDKVNLTWTIPNDGGSALTKYDLYPSQGTAVYNMNPSLSSYTWDAPTSARGTSVNFFLVPSNAIGNGGNSNNPSLTMWNVPSTPSAPSASTSGGQNTVTWSAPSSDGGTAVTNYKLFRNGSGSPLVTLASNVFSYTDSSVTLGTGYYYKVEAINTVGANAQSSASNTVTPALAPSTPSAPTATFASNTSNTVTWSAPNNNGSAITNYELFRNGSSIGNVGNVLTYTDTGLTVGSSNFYSIKAINAVGTSPLSSNSNTILNANAPDAPTNLATVAGVPITMTWTAPSSDMTITNYKIYRDGTLIQTLGVAGSFSDNTVVGGTTYSYEVSAVSVAGEGNKSSSSSAVAGLPADPPSLGLTHNSANLNINVAITDGSSMGTGTLTNYTVERSADGSTGWTSVGTPNSSPFVDTVPSAGTWYYRANTITNHGTSGYSSVVNIAHVDPDTPSITSASYNNPANSNIEVAITNGASFGTGDFTNYTIERSADGSTNWTSAGTATSSPFTDTNVPSVGDWYYRVATNTPHGTSAFSSNGQASPVAPDTPTGITSTIANPNPSPLTVSVGWTAPSNFGTGNLTGYEVYRDGSLITTTGTSTGYTDTVPSAGTFVYTVKTVTAHATSVLSASTSITTPTVPVSDSSVTLSIDNPNPNPLDITVSFVAPSSDGGSAVLTYDLHSSSDNITFTQIATGVTADQTVTVSSAGTWYFKSLSTNNVGSSTLGSAVSIATPSIPTSDASVTLSIDNPNPNPLDITVSFTAPTSDGGSSVTGYNLSSSPDDITYTQIASAVTADQTVTVSSAGTWYFKSQAINNIGTAALGSAVSIATPSVPGIPSLTLNIADPNALPFDITSSFTAPTSNGGSAVTGYNLYYSSDNITYSSIASAVTADQLKVVSGIGTHYFKAEAINNVGTGSLSSAFSIATPSLPTAVSDLAVSSVTDTTVGLTWTEPANGGSNIVDYDVLRDGVTIATVTTPGYSDTGLTTQTSYVYEVFVRNNVGFSLISNQITQVTQGVPAVVPSFQATTASLEAITLSWTAPNDFGAAITGYLIEKESPTGNGFATVTTTGVVTAYSDTGLTPVTQYNYRISAINSYGSSPTTTSSTTTLPAPPTNVVATPSTSTSELVVTWTAPADTTGMTGYQIYRENGIGNGFTLINTTTTLGTTFTDTGLTTNVFYNYKLKSVTPQGNSAYSNTYAQTTFHVPDPVTSLSATAGELIDASLTWSSPSTPYGTITNYEIYQSTTTPAVPTTLIDTVSSSVQSYTATNLDPTVTYYWMVSPVTIHGSNNSGNIASATATSEIVIGDIELSTDVNTDTVDILFEQVRTGNSTALTVTYPNTYDLTCETEYKFGRNTQSYSNLVPTTVSSTKSSHTFNFNNSDNEIISIRCYDENTNPGGVNPNDPNDGKDQINFSTQPIVTQVNDFQKGLYGISGGFGIFDLATLFVVIISMVGFNRKNPAVGVGIMITFIGAMAYFGIIETPTIVMGAIALVAVLAIGVARNKL